MRPAFGFVEAATSFLTAGLVVIALFVGVQVYKYGPYQDGRCGAQKVEPRFLPFSDFDRDEFLIEEQWVKAHGKPCEYIWTRGPLGPGSSPYWPRLHFISAAWFPSISEIRSEIAAADEQAIFAKDPLGRTILHWLVIHPADRPGEWQDRKALIDELVQRGLSLDAKDEDGLSPRDWQLGVPPDEKAFEWMKRHF